MLIVIILMTTYCSSWCHCLLSIGQ